MKNSTLLRLFFISIGLPLACASSPTSSTLTSKPKSKPKSKSKPASLLVDKTNVAPAVQLKDQGILVQSVPGESQVPEKDERTKKFEELINNNQYEGIVDLGKKMSDEELLKCLCQVVTTLDQFKSLYEYLKQGKLVPDFLAHGEMVVVKEVIVGANLLEANQSGQCNSIYDAIALSLSADRHERIAGLFEAARERPDWKNDFDLFVDGFFIRYLSKKNSIPLKRFLTLHGEEFSKQHPATFKTICQRLVGESRLQLDNQDSQKLLIDLVGQPSLLTPVAFARIFLYIAVNDTTRANFIKYGYREAIEEGLKGEYREGGIHLWRVMVKTDPNQFTGAYPSTDEARTVALKHFKTKQEREEEWAERNASILLTQLELLVPELLPKVLLPIIAGYAITWVVV